MTEFSYDGLFAANAPVTTRAANRPTIRWRPATRRCGNRWRKSCAATGR